MVPDAADVTHADDPTTVRSTDSRGGGGVPDSSAPSHAPAGDEDVIDAPDADCDPDAAGIRQAIDPESTSAAAVNPVGGVCVPALSL